MNMSTSPYAACADADGRVREAARVDLDPGLLDYYLNARRIPGWAYVCGPGQLMDQAGARDAELFAVSEYAAVMTVVEAAASGELGLPGWLVSTWHATPSEALADLDPMLRQRSFTAPGCERDAFARTVLLIAACQDPALVEAVRGLVVSAYRAVVGVRGDRPAVRAAFVPGQRAGGDA